jgi:hypothetical protein
MRRSSLRWTIPTLLALQLALLWVQGAQIHRQNQVLTGLREDIQTLADTLQDGKLPANDQEEAPAVPARYQAPSPPPRRVAVLGAEEEQDAAAKELKASRDSAQKAVKDAREVQSKLSIEENIRKADENRKVNAATTSWQRWVYGALAFVVLGLIARAVLRRNA